MANLLVSYDLNKPGQNYEAIIERIKSLGNWAKVHKSFWYVKSSLSADQARNKIREVIDSTDTIFVADAGSGNAAWQNLSPEVSEFISAKWRN